MTIRVPQDLYYLAEAAAAEANWSLSKWIVQQMRRGVDSNADAYAAPPEKSTAVRLPPLPATRDFVALARHLIVMPTPDRIQARKELALSEDESRQLTREMRKLWDTPGSPFFAPKRPPAPAPTSDEQEAADDLARILAKKMPPNSPPQ